MRFARRLGLGLLAAVNLAAVACTGGPGSADQGGDTGDQYSGVTGDNGTTVSSGTADVPTTPTAQPPADLNATDYDQTCTQDSDCTGVAAGAVCNSCNCANAAINRKDQGKFQIERSTRQVQCLSAGQQTSATGCGACTNFTPHCDANRCAFR